MSDRRSERLLRGVGDPALVDLVDHRLGAVEGLGDVLGHRVAELGDLAGHADEPPQQRVLLDDAGVAAGVGGGRRGRHDLRQHGRAADRLEQVGPAQLVGDGDRVDRLARRVERVDGVVDVAVGRLVEVGRGDDARRPRRWPRPTASWRRAATPPPGGRAGGRAPQPARRGASWSSTSCSHRAVQPSSGTPCGNARGTTLWISAPWRVWRSCGRAGDEPGSAVATRRRPRR